jgi:hypothetical protein
MNIKTRTVEQLFLVWQFSPSADPGFDSLIISIMLVSGNRDLEASAVSVRVDGGHLGVKPRSNAVADIPNSIKRRS